MRRVYDNRRRQHRRRRESEPRRRSPERGPPSPHRRRLIHAVGNEADTLWNLRVGNSQQDRLCRAQMIQFFPAARTALDMEIGLPAIVLWQLPEKIIP